MIKLINCLSLLLLDLGRKLVNIFFLHLMSFVQCVLIVLLKLCVLIVFSLRVYVVKMY